MTEGFGQVPAVSSDEWFGRGGSGAGVGMQQGGREGHARESRVYFLDLLTVSQFLSLPHHLIIFLFCRFTWQYS